ncbi:MAG: 50S ribosomal protein L24 [Candidatus Daviesbacteria bacterium]|nr:50S ribosomal protein L24 [Candidatus Daviesbacteria bacterium]
MKIQTGDSVKILLGKDRGKTGKVLRVWTKEDKVLVEGINMYKRHVKKTAQHEGGILDIPKQINISNVAFMCPECKKPTRIGMKIEADTKYRFCKKCKEKIVVKKEKK